MNELEQLTVSTETLERLKQELQDLTTNGRDEVGERLKHARELGDISENAEYDAAKEVQAMLEARIRQLQYMIKHAVIRDVPTELEAAGPGMVVAVKEPGSNDIDEYLLANSSEEKMKGIRTVTTSSPLGKALVGRKIGESINVEAPAGKFSVEIVSLRVAG